MSIGTDFYFAFTPLHLRIISSLPKANSSILVVLNTKDLSEYVKSYIKEDEFHSVYILKKKYFSFYDLLRLKYKHRNIHNIFVGNFKFINFRMISFFIRYKNLVTFDDGIGSVTGNYFHSDGGFYKEKLFGLLNISIERIFRKHQQHISIYRGNRSQSVSKISYLKIKKIERKFSYRGNVLITTDKSEVGTMSQLEECELFKKLLKIIVSAVSYTILQRNIILIWKS